MRISRREFLKYCTIAAGALGLTTTDLLKIEQAIGKVGDPSAPHVVWLPGQSCTGCTMSLTNSIFYTDVGSLVLNDINLDYSETLAAASGEKIVESAISAIGKPMVLVLEGAIPHGGTGDVNEEFCTVWTRSSGIVAAGSKVGGASQTNGILTRKINPAGVTLMEDDVIKAGSEIVDGTTIPAGSIVASAADRAALGGSYSGTATYGDNTLNTAVTLSAALTSTGDITMYGGTDSGHPSGSTLASGSIILDGTNYHDSFDRADLELYGTPVTTTDAITWTWASNGGMLLTTTSGTGVTMGANRELSGMVELAIGSTLAAGTILQAGTTVDALADRLVIDASLVAFGFTAAGDGNVLTGTLVTAVGADYVLAGDISLPVSPATASGFLVAGTTDHDKTMLNESVLFATSAAAVLCVGTCSSFGGIPAAKGNRTGASGALYKGYVKAGKFNGPDSLVQFAAKTVNIPGCPPHPDWIVGTIAFLLKTNFQLPQLEAYGRPMDYFGQYQCNAGPCEWRYNQGYSPTEEANYFNPKTFVGSTAITTDSKITTNYPGFGYLPVANATINSSKLYKYKWDLGVGAQGTTGLRYVGCLGPIGCKGRKTKADCSLRRWNGDNPLPQYGTNWCVGVGSGCKGCTEPTFPDKVGKFFNFA